jgi:diacylglycerol kinase (ATP)
MPKTISLPADISKTHVTKVALLYNPKSGAKKGEKLAKQATKMLNSHGVAVDLISLERKNHAKELCRTMDVFQYNAICILGGDGTFHESINGYMERTDDARLRVPLAALPGGTGNSFVLELQGNVDIKTAVEHVIRGLSCPIDISKVFFPSTETHEYLFNSLHWGMASNVNVMAEQLRWMGKAVRYTTASLLEVFKGEKTLAIIQMEDKDGKRTTVKGEYSLCIANNIRTAAKGMKLAPDAMLNDGLIDVILINSKKTTDLAQLYPKFHDGSHVKLKFVEYKQVKSFSIIPLEKDDPEYVEGGIPDVAEEILDIDGELSGIAPFKCTVIPRAIRVIV